MSEGLWEYSSGDTYKRNCKSRTWIKRTRVVQQEINKSWRLIDIDLYFSNICDTVSFFFFFRTEKKEKLVISVSLNDNTLIFDTATIFKKQDQSYIMYFKDLLE